ncbi:hypothetical protein HDU67_002992, partial [Dinochytrium kinnereticum]
MRLLVTSTALCTALAILLTPPPTVAQVTSEGVTFSVCETAVLPVFDFGVLRLTTKVLDIAIEQGFQAANYTYQVLAANDGVIPASFSQTDLISGTVTFSPNVPLQSIGATKSSLIQFLVSDPVGKTGQCTLNLQIRFGFAPQLDVTASFSVVTFTNTPVVLDRNVVSLNEAHGLSMWNMNWTSSWIDNGAIRYNPVNFIGSAVLSLQLSGRTVSAPLPITGDPFVVNVTISTSQGTSVVIQPTAAPPFSLLRCPVLRPDPFPFSFKMPFGPYCGSFSTVANTDFTWNAPFLGVRLVANTRTPANITFGTGVQPQSTQFPSDLNKTVQFAGYLDYGAFYIHVDPPTTAINSLVLTSPELSYEQAMTLTQPSQITGWNIDTSTLFYVTAIENPVPRLRTTLYSAGSFIFLAGVSGTNAGSTSNFGVNSFLGAWGVRDYTFKENSFGFPVLRLRG